MATNQNKKISQDKLAEMIQNGFEEARKKANTLETTLSTMNDTITKRFDRLETILLNTASLHASRVSILEDDMHKVKAKLDIK